jgi:hypothetical protein
MRLRAATTRRRRQAILAYSQYAKNRASMLSRGAAAGCLAVSSKLLCITVWASLNLLS